MDHLRRPLTQAQGLIKARLTVKQNLTAIVDFATMKYMFPGLVSWSALFALQLNNNRAAIVAFIFLAAVTSRAGEPPFPPYVAADLGTLGGSSFATAVNDLGQVVGYSVTQGAERAFLWLPRPAYGFDRGMHDLGALPGGWSHANDINNLGQVVGRSRTGGVNVYNQPIEHAFFWDPTIHEMVDLGTLPIYELGSEAAAINDDGWIAGTSYGEFPFVAEAFVFLPEPAHGWPSGLNRIGFSFAADINEIGQAIGWYENDIYGSARATLWLPVSAYGLPAGSYALPGLEDTSSRAYGINDFGEVVGVYAADGGFDPNHAFSWQDSQVDPLVTPVPFSIAGAINNNGQIIGGAGGPITWRDGVGLSVRHLLPASPSWTVHVVQGINGKEQIVGYATINTELRGVLLSPVQADINTDHSVDVLDQAILVSCMLGPDELTTIDCNVADLDRDGDVDFVDFRTWVLVFSGVD